MSQPFIGQIIGFAGNFAPSGWALCNGQLLSISSNAALFSILGTSFGGNGTTTFALPDLRGRVPVHAGQGPGLSPYVLGESTGTENVTLTVGQMPAHSHLVNANASNGTAPSPNGHLLAQAVDSTKKSVDVYSVAPASKLLTLAAATIASAGGSLPHANIQPVLAINFIIALVGIFPSRN